MIVDAILDRKDGCSYNPMQFGVYVASEEKIFNLGCGIEDAIEEADEEELKAALCRYIENNGYNPKIKDYIHSVEWMTGRNE